MTREGGVRRSCSPPGSADGAPTESTYFLSANRNKESIVLNLKDDDDHQILLELVCRADVLVENFRTGVVMSHELNPRLVILSITGSGPDDPQKVGTPITDLLAGMYGAYGVLAALIERGRTGKGTVVRTSLLAAAVGVHGFQSTRWTVAGEVGRAQGNHHVSIAPYGLFHCDDGFVQIAVGSEGLWQRFCAGFGIDPATPEFAGNGQRVANRERLIQFRTRDFHHKPGRDDRRTRKADQAPSVGVLSSVDPARTIRVRCSRRSRRAATDTLDPGDHQ